MRPTTKIPKIIFEDQNIIVLDKPAGLLVHAAESTKEQTTLVQFLLTKYPELKGIGEDPARPGIVHRLDKDTSGIMVVARNQKSFLFLKNQFKNRLVKKNYQALVFGHPLKAELDINMPIKRMAKGTYGARHAADIEKLKPSLANLYRPAQTHVKILEKLGDFTLLDVQPKTGRTHQIRVHLKAIGLPIVGDQLYSSIKQRQLAEKTWHLSHQFLHATSLALKHPASHQFLTFDAPMPQELQRILQTLRSRHQ